MSIMPSTTDRKACVTEKIKFLAFFFWEDQICSLAFSFSKIDGHVDGNLQTSKLELRWKEAYTISPDTKASFVDRKN